ncbi:kinesin light chain 3 [Patellaria atrata CBS 101060]|uniref:Kinesin light chain 3 n=1 Tax=Patellaria atrata CBS 101060 TaxID=1346257 RepID=A0A9P4S0L2_9PEZI|nr:kinesin light chain 3 [Patellaria atrata CBS 101060]
MRLLHFNHSGGLILTDFGRKSIPPYAILSHRWRDDEVLFEDLGSDTYKEKDGFRKIKFCAERAAQDQLQYFWIDTCCIDKWNLRERSKAINSMFRWYRNATKCYVFLSDVSVSTAAEIPQRSTWEASFRKSEWFTRGWTLQELIAPVSVEFFSSEGLRIGDKISLKQLVCEVTGVPLKALSGCPLDEFTVSKRMEWAKHRKTTEEEDKIYCLLGILDISMPTSYGEGKEKALRRLQMEVEAATSAPSIIPFSRNDHFVGRESQLAELEAKLLRDKQTTISAIVGPRGIGKSQLALELAYKIRQRNKNCSIFWIDASDIDSLYQSYISIAQKLDVPGWDDENADIKQLVKFQLSKKDAKQCLLIFDNTEDITLGSGGFSTARATHLRDYLPQSELCSIIFTTINSDTAKSLSSQNIVELGEMTPDTAQRMLENYLNTPVSRSEQQEAKLLLQELLYLPLAIVQAAAYINTRNVTLQKYRSQLVRRKKEALERDSELSKDKLQEYGIKSSIATTLLISMDQIHRSDTLAADYLFLTACVDRKDIPLDFLEASSPREREDAIKVLSSYALILRRPAESALDLHQLVHGALREWLRKQERLDQWTRNAIKQLLRVFPDPYHGNRSKWRRLLPHAKYALSHSPVEQEGGNRLTLTWKYAMTLYSDGRYNESEELFMQVMETRKRVLGDEHPDTLTSMANLASTYRNQGRWKEAEELEVQVMETSKRVLGDEHPNTLIGMGNLASTYRYQGGWKEAEELEVRVMETSKRMRGDEHPNTLTSMANLASTYRSQGRWKEAEELEVQVMETRKRVLGDEHPDTLTSMANLASTYRNQGRWKEAEELEVQVMETSKRVLGDEHPNTLTSMTNLASTFWDQGWWKEAEELDVQVMETRKRVLGDEHPDMLASMANLASTYRNQGRWKEAEDLEVQVMETSKRVLGDEHPNTLIAMANLASTYRNQGRWKEAEDLEVQVIETRKRVLGDEHPDTLTSMDNLASTFWNEGRWKEAEELEVQVMETRKRVLGHEHPNTLISMANLASTYRNQGRWKEAEDLDVQVIETSKRVLGDEHPNTLTSMTNLASTYRNQGRWKESEELEVQVMETKKRVLGDEHPNTLTSMTNLASTYRNQGRWKEAEDLEVQVMKTSKRVLGDEHLNTLTSMANLASTFWNQGRWKEAEELEVQVMETSKRVLGNEHPNTLTSMANLASTYRNQGRWKEAEDLEVRVVETSKRMRGDEHPNTLTSMANLASTYRNQGRWKEAEELEVQVMETMKRVLGDEHPNTLTSMANLASTYRNQGRWKEAEELEVQVMETRKVALGDDIQTR